MAFTDWAALKTQMLNDLADSKWNVSEYTVDGKTTKYRSFDEFRSALDYVIVRAGESAGSVSGRTNARSVRQ